MILRYIPHQEMHGLVGVYMSTWLLQAIDVRREWRKGHSFQEALTGQALSRSRRSREVVVLQFDVAFTQLGQHRMREGCGPHGDVPTQSRLSRPAI